MYGGMNWLPLKTMKKEPLAGNNWLLYKQVVKSTVWIYHMKRQYEFIVWINNMSRQLKTIWIDTIDNMNSPIKREVYNEI